MKPLGCQVHSVRELAAKDYLGTLRRLAEIGYKGVEIGRLGDCGPKEVRKVLDEMGVACIGLHGAIPNPEGISEAVDTLGALGCKTCLCNLEPPHYESADLVRSAAERFAQARQLLAPHGVRLVYHNHWWEMKRLDGQLAYDLFFQTAGEALAEIDVYWAAVGQAVFGEGDVVELVGRYRSRLPLMHLKDGPLTGGEPRAANVAVGSGAMDIPACVKAADPDVLEWLIVEFDSCETDILQAVRDSYDYITRQGLAAGAR
ncbi:MAG TPA: sugar phosphate isomerase/epimerase [Phycisphaerae bacterium]|nr:sugar phosphate isomerase/epimerase [Phycisphaerae bacterium]HUT56309.1 sugar phosphate isomerase/epimerase [Phycisphaerae bacterium]